MAGKKGRSGRKRTPKRRINFNTKIDPDLRDALQALADKRGVSLSREIEMRLRQSVRDSRNEQPFVRALCYLVSRSAQALMPGRPRNAAEIFVFRGAIDRILYRLALEKSPDIPNEMSWKEIAETPHAPPGARVAVGFGDMLWGAVLAENMDDAPDDLSEIYKDAGVRPFTMADVRRDLGIKSRPAKIIEITDEMLSPARRPTNLSEDEKQRWIEARFGAQSTTTKEEDK